MTRAAGKSMNRPHERHRFARPSPRRKQRQRAKDVGVRLQTMAAINCTAGSMSARVLLLAHCAKQRGRLMARVPRASAGGLCRIPPVRDELDRSVRARWQVLPHCGELSIGPSDDGASVLVLGFHFSTTSLQSPDVSIVLGPSPSVGSYSSQTSSQWSAVGITDSRCQYVAGSESVPPGSFRLSLSSLEIVDPGAEDSADSGMEAGHVDGAAIGRCEASRVHWL